jgi:hypothetical protein
MEEDDEEEDEEEEVDIDDQTTTSGRARDARTSTTRLAQDTLSAVPALLLLVSQTTYANYPYGLSGSHKPQSEPGHLTAPALLMLLKPLRESNTEPRISIQDVDNHELAPLGSGPVPFGGGVYSHDWIIMR